MYKTISNPKTKEVISKMDSDKHLFDPICLVDTTENDEEDIQEI